MTTKAEKKAAKKARTRAKLAAKVEKKEDFVRVLKGGLPGRGSEVLFEGKAYTRYSDNAENVRIECLRGLGLKQFESIVGDIPAYYEILENCAIELQSRMFGEEFGWPQLGGWKDEVLRYYVGSELKFVLPIRVPHDDIVVKRPAYGDTITLTPLEFGIASIMMAGSMMSHYTYQHGDEHGGVQMGLFYYRNDEVADLYQNGLSLYDPLDLGNVHRVLD